MTRLPDAAPCAGYRSACDLLASLRAGETSAAVVIEELLAVNAANTGLGAFYHIDAAAVRQAAANADALRAAGKDLPLLGLPIGVKDNIDTLGIPTTAGTPALSEHRPARNAPVLQRLLDQGAFVFGKTAMHELAFGTSGNNAFRGATRNPYDTACVPGGSSSGTAAAIAAGLVPVGLGSDTGGSVRIPAAFCGLAGLRPTTGRYPAEGVVPISRTRDTVGPLARTVADLSLLDDAIVGASPAMPPVAPRDIRLGVPDAFFFDDLDSQVAEQTGQALDALARAGVKLVAVPGTAFGELYDRAGFAVTLFETRPTMEAYLAYSGLDITFEDIAAKAASPDVKEILADLAGRPEQDLESAYRQAIEHDRPSLQAFYSETMAAYRLDGIAFPTCKLPPLPIGQDLILRDGVSTRVFEICIQNTGPGSLAGVPGVTVPCAMTPSGLPLGLSVDGAFWSDRHLLRIGATLESVLRAHAHAEAA